MKLASENLTHTADQIARLQGARPPMFPDALGGSTRVTGRFITHPFDSYVPGLKENCIVHFIDGQCEGRVKFGSKILAAPMVPGTISVVPKGQDSWRRTTRALTVSTVHLGADRLQTCADHLFHGQHAELRNRLSWSDPKLVTLMAMICDEVESDDPTSRLFLEQLIDLLCLQLLRAHSSLGAPPSPPLAQRGLAKWQIKRVTSYMLDHLGDDITLQELANVVQLSRFHFCTAFRMATGCTPYARLTALRMERARTLLADPSLRVIDIALCLGYATPAALTARFRKTFGVTPRAFRRAL